jgi:RNA polymerase sigma factor (sigma-70 family)
MTRRTNEEWVAALGNDGRDGTDVRNDFTAAFEDLGRYLYRVVYNYLLMRQDLPKLRDLPDTELAELAHELVQESLERILLKLGTYAYRGKFRFWAAAIAKNIARRELDKAKWRYEVRIPESDDCGEDGIDFWDRIAGAGNGLCPEQTVQFNEVLDVIRRIIDRYFTEDQRRAFVGRFGEGKKYREISAGLGKTMNRVYLLIFEARKKLKHGLEGAHWTLAEIYTIFEKEE